MSATSTDVKAATTAPKERRRSSRDRLSINLERFGLPVALLAVIVLFSVLRPDTFFTVANLQSLLITQTVLAIVAIAFVVPLVVGQLDLSLASILGLCTLAAAGLMSEAGVPLVPAAALAIALGALVGLVNGLVVSRLGVDAIITTLGTGSIIAGATIWYSGGQTITSDIPEVLLEFGSGRWLGVPSVFVCLVVTFMLVGYLLRQTPMGRSMYALGNNAQAARLVGLPVRRLTMLAFVIGGAVAGLGGVAQVAVAGGADPQFGPNLLLPGLSAVFLGATTIRPGQPNVTGTLVAVAFLAVATSGFALLGAPAYVEPIFYGAALIVAVSASLLMRRRRTGS